VLQDASAWDIHCGFLGNNRFDRDLVQEDPLALQPNCFSMSGEPYSILTVYTVLHCSAGSVKCTIITIRVLQEGEVTILSAGPEATQQAWAQHSGHAGYAPILTQYPSFALPQVCTDGWSFHVLVSTCCQERKLLLAHAFQLMTAVQVVIADSMKLLSCYTNQQSWRKA